MTCKDDFNSAGTSLDGVKRATRRIEEVFESHGLHVEPDQTPLATAEEARRLLDSAGGRMALFTPKDFSAARLVTLIDAALS